MFSVSSESGAASSLPFRRFPFRRRQPREDTRGRALCGDDLLHAAARYSQAGRRKLYDSSATVVVVVLLRDLDVVCCSIGLDVRLSSEQ